MDNIKLANILFKDLDLTYEECLNAYPKRILPIGAEVTRVAPSPTGYLHIGTVYQAFIDKLIAYHSNGCFYMRLEDTDNKREIKEAGDIAYDMLSYFGLKPDEGYRGSKNDEIGNYGPYVQSQRANIYKCFAKYLVEIGRAYPCFCEMGNGKEDVLKRRQEQLNENNDIEEKDACRDLTFEEIEKKLSENKPFAIRLKSMGNAEKTFKFVDRIKGEREIRENTKDIIILKSNGVPPYSLAHAVDDTLMGTTTVVRGEEWYPSLASHLELFNCLNLPAPKYAHTPVICKLDEDGNKRKLSKRKDPEADARSFIEAGYPVSSVMEYLSNLINSDFEDWRKKNPTLSYFEFPFSIEKMGSNNPMFDFVKLDDCSKQVISRFSGEKIYENVLSWAEKYDKNFFKIIKDKKDFCINLFNIDRINTNNPRKDISKWSMVENLYFYMFKPFNELKINDYDFDTKFDKNTIKNALKNYVDIYDGEDDKQVWFEKIKSLCKKLNFADNMKDYKKNPELYLGNVADLSGIIRVAVTTKRNTPDLFEIMRLLGKNEIKNRINLLIEKL